MLDLEQTSETPPMPEIERTLFETILQNFEQCVSEKDVEIIDPALITTFLKDASEFTTIKKLVCMPDYFDRIASALDTVSEMRKSRKIKTNLNQIVTRNLASNMEFDYMKELNENDGSAICI